MYRFIFTCYNDTESISSQPISLNSCKKYDVLGAYETWRDGNNIDYIELPKFAITMLQ